MKIDFTFNYNGEFFVTKAPTKKYSGKIVFDGASDIDLVIKDINNEDLGHFQTTEDIYGETDKGLFALYKCSLTGMRPFVNKSNLTYKVKYAVNGRHVYGENKYLFSRAIVTFDTLSEWMAISGFEHGGRDPDKKFELSFTRPPVIELIKNEKFSRGFQWHFNNSRKRGEYTLIEVAEFYLESFNPSGNPNIHIDELHREFVMFRDFLSAVTLWPCNIKWMRLHSALHHELQGKLWPDAVQLHFGQFSPYAQDSVHTASLLFPYTELSEDLQDIYSEWLLIFDKIDPSIKILMEYIRAKTPFNSNKFLNLAQAIETYHRRTTKLTKELSKEDHRKRTDEIISAVPEQHRNYLAEVLKTSNDMIFANRLIDLISGFDGTPLEGKFPNKTSFVTKVKDSRNYYTHYPEDLEKKALKGQSLEKATTTLFFMLLCCIFRDIGVFSSAKRYERILKWFEYVELYSKEKDYC